MSHEYQKLKGFKPSICLVSGINKIMSNSRHHYLILSIMPSGHSVANGTHGNVLKKLFAVVKPDHLQKH